MDYLKIGDPRCGKAYGFQPTVLANIDAWLEEQVQAGRVVGRWNDGLAIHLDPSRQVELLARWKEHGMTQAGPVLQVDGIGTFWQAFEFFSEGNLDFLVTNDWFIAFPAEGRTVLEQCGAVVGARQEARGQEVAPAAATPPPDLSAVVGNDPFLLNQYGKMFAFCRDYAKAGECFRTAAEVMPEYSEPYGNLGALMWQVGKRREAFVLFVEALAKNPHRVVSQLNFFDAGHELEEYAAMASVLEELIPSVPEYAEFRHHLAVCYVRLNRAAEGKALLENLLAQRPDDQEAIQLLASVGVPAGAASAPDTR